MRFLVDTNVLLYAANADAREHKRTRRALDQWLRGRVPWCIGWNVVYEFMRVATHARVFPKPLGATEALAFLGAVVESDLVTVLTPTARHWEVLEETVNEVGRISGNLFHDLHTAVLMREHGVTEIRTADQDFRKFAFLTVVDPTRP